MPKPTMKLEKTCAQPVAGIDEAGRGPLAGPVVAAAVIIKPGAFLRGVNDSKKLSASERNELFRTIQLACHVGIGMASVAEIDELNILHATMLAMSRAYDALPIKPAYVLVDGNRLPALPCDALAVVKGDAKCLRIAAASIIAKVTRDRMMDELDKLFPQYGFASHAGYGTEQHMGALKQYGATVHHRTSFAPVREALKKAAL